MNVAPPSRTAARARELFVLATILAVVMWGIFIVDVGGTRRGRLSGQPIGTDFVAFYSYARIGLAGSFAMLASPDAFFREQVRLIPESAATRHPPLYPAQVSLLLSPLGHLAYPAAYAVWVLASVAIYGAIVAAMTRRTPRLAVWPGQVAAVAAASPALWFLVQHGQLSALSLAALSTTWWGLAGGGRWVAGAGLGLLAFKVSFFIPALAVCLLAGRWGLAGIAVGVATAQYAIAVPWTGVVGLEAYLQLLVALLRRPDVVAGNPWLMHSLRTLWSGILPDAIATVVYVLSALGVVAIAASIWWKADDALHVAAALGAAMVLASPHVYAYDLVLLAPLTIASADLVLAGGAARGLAPLMCAGYLAPLWGVPAAAVGLPVTSLVLAAWLVVFWQSVERNAGPASPAGRPAH